MRDFIAYPFFILVAVFMWIACSISGNNAKEMLRGWADRLEDEKK